MSARAAALGVVRRLQQMLGDQTGAHVGYRPDLHPPAVAGQWYCAVGNNSAVANGAYGNNYIAYRHTQVICLTFKYGWVPDDRLASILMNSTWFAGPTPEVAAEGRPALPEREEVQPGVVEMAELVHDLLLEDYECVKAMNYYLGTDKENDLQTASAPPQVDEWWQFAEPYHSGTIGPPVFQDASWVGGGPGTGTGRDFVTVNVTVAGALSIRPSRYRRGLDLENYSTNY